MNNKKQKYAEGQMVRFKAFSVLSGDYEETGKIECEGTVGIARGIMSNAEYGNLEKDTALIIKLKDRFHNIQRHLVFNEDIIRVLSEEEAK